jgi:integrase
VIDLDPGTVAVLRAWKRERGTLSLVLRRDDALVFGDLNNRHRQPEHFSRTWGQTVRRAIGDDINVPPIRLHDVRHTHATILQVSGVASAASFSSSCERRLPAEQRDAPAATSEPPERMHPA